MTRYPQEVLRRPFGAASRAWMLAQHFATHAQVAPEDAWKHVYRLLLWTDSTTALAHCYESDKSQPGRHWYARALAFHKWLSDHLGCEPSSLHREIDLLFRKGTRILAVSEAREMVKRALEAEKQRAPFAAHGMPEPGTDPDLEEDVSSILATHYGKPASPETVHAVVGMVRSRLALEHKRKNLVGEGFEDVLAEVIRRSDAAAHWEVHCRKVLHELPGFREPPKGEKPRTVDLALVHKTARQRILASVKWSVRADREEQFGVDYDAYARNEASGEPFGFMFVTNEFDAARLVSACSRRHFAQPLFAGIIHVNPDGLLAVYGAEAQRSAGTLLRLLTEGRVVSLEQWLQTLGGGSRPATVPSGT